MKRFVVLLVSFLSFFLARLPAHAASQEEIRAATRIGHERLVQSGQEVSNWLSHGRTYKEQRFSPLEQINSDNVTGLE